MDSMRVTLAILIVVLFCAAMPATCEERPTRLGVVANAGATSAFGR